MTTFNVSVNKAKAAPMTLEQITEVYAGTYPMWAAAAIASHVTHDFTNQVHGADKDVLEIDTAVESYTVLDMDEAASQSSIGGFNADDYEDADDEEEAIESWVEDVEANLTGHIDTNRDGENSEFLVLVS